MDDHTRRLSRSFGSVADAYDRGRPPFPREAAGWLVGRDAATVLELGAGTGKLTEQLVALGHDVHATDPDPEMLAVLRRRLPDVRTSEAAAEEVPLPDRSVDVVVAGQAFHWFDHERALPEIARVLRPGGVLAVAWNVRDERIPWVRKLGRILAGPAAAVPQEAEAVDVLVRSELFGFVEQHTLGFWQDVDRESIVDLVRSRSCVATLAAEERDATVAAVLALYDDYGRGMDGMRLPYVCRCHRARVAERAEPDAAPVAGPPTGEDPPRADGTDTDMLLIDFR